MKLVSVKRDEDRRCAREYAPTGEAQERLTGLLFMFTAARLANAFN
jgi:hypothetical protein